MAARKTVKKCRYVDALFANGFEDQQAAAIEAGYAEGSAKVSASRLMNDEWVMGEIARRRALVEGDKPLQEFTDTERTINTLNTIAHGTILDLGAFIDGKFVLDPAKITPETAKMINEIKVTTNKQGHQQFEVKFERRMPALATLSRIFGLMTGDVHLHKHEHTHYANQTDEQLIDQITGILDTDPSLLSTLVGSIKGPEPRTVN